MAAEAASSSSTPAIPKGTAAALQLTKCKLSASLLPNNLIFNSSSSSSKHCYAYIHRNEVCMIDSKAVALGSEKADSIRVAYTDKDAINGIAFAKLSGGNSGTGVGEVLIVINQAGAIFIYDAESGQKLIHSYKYSKPMGGSSSAAGGAAGSPTVSLKEQSLRGIATDGKESLFVGNGAGDILVFTLSKAKFNLLKVLNANGADVAPEHAYGISALCYSIPHATLVSGDEFGSVAFWTGGAEGLSQAKMTKLEGGGGSSAAQQSQHVGVKGNHLGAPVNCLVTGVGSSASAPTAHVVAAAFTTGHIRLYDVSKRQITHEIAAHTRAINALDMHPTKPILLAASEDTFVSCWTVPTAANPQIKSLMAESPALGLLTGCKFGGGANAELIVTTIYDSRSLALMHTP